MNRETILTSGPGGRILTNANVWSADGQWIVFDTRSDPAGSVFDGTRIQAVHVETHEIRTLFESRHGACCGVVTCHPTEMKVVCILGPEFPTAEWSYGPSRRQGIVINFDGRVQNLDARDLDPPFTPGALSGGSHLHMWHNKGDWISFTYEDEVLGRTGVPPVSVCNSPCSVDGGTVGTPALARNRPDAGIRLRNIGIAYPDRPVTVPKTHPRNHDGDYFCKLITRSAANPLVESDEISRACEEAWVGATRRLAFQGTVHTAAGPVVEVFLVELLRSGFAQHRLTRTTHRQFPGVQGPRHWLRSSSDGSKIGFFMKDELGVAQFWTLSPRGGEPQQVTDGPLPMASAFTWHPDGRSVACIVDGSVSLIDTVSGTVTRLSAKGELRPEACVFSPDGARIAFVRTVDGVNQVTIVEAE